MVHVKICGITNLEDALASVEAGANLLGFNFYPKSARYIEPAAALRIVDQLPRSVMTVGVFVNEDKGMVEHIAKKLNLSAVQLHGDESVGYCREVKAPFVIKALRVHKYFEANRATRYDADAILLDGFTSDAYGGTGQTFDWSLAQRTQRLVPKLFLAGGLNINNVTTAIASVKPYAIDVCSSLELAPGRKDTARVRELIQAVRDAEAAQRTPLERITK